MHPKFFPSTRDQRHRTGYFPGAMRGEVAAEAARQGRSFSWIVQQAWRISRPTIQRFPSNPSATEATP